MRCENSRVYLHELRGIFSGGFLHIRILFRRFYGLLYWLLFHIFYGRLSPTCYISPRAHILNKRNTYIGPSFIIRSGASLSGKHIECGRNVRIGFGSHLFGEIYIGNDVMIAPNVVMASGYHGMARGQIAMIEQYGVSKGAIRIRNDVWVGGNAVILSGVELGEGCVVGAGAVVTKSVPPYAIVVGNPAKVLRYRE